MANVFCLSGRSACPKSLFHTPIVEIAIIIKFTYSIYSIIGRNIRVIHIHPGVQIFSVIIEGCRLRWCGNDEVVDGRWEEGRLRRWISFILFSALVF